MSQDIHGILLLDKPLGVSSAGAVARVKRLFDARKAGHTGSLDPLASGFLAIGLGEGTKFGSHLFESDKTYRVGVRLGERTASADRETEVIERRALAVYREAELASALASFPRTYQQVPPMNSAIKQAGKPLYAYARAGITRERAPREVTLHDISLRHWATPDLVFDVTCSKGTYIRVLAEDIAARLGTIGHLIELRRLSVSPFQTEAMHSFEALEAMSATQRLGVLLGIDASLLCYPRLDLDLSLEAALLQGRAVAVSAAPGTVRIYGAEGQFLGLGNVDDSGQLQPRRLIVKAANRA